MDKEFLLELLNTRSPTGVEGELTSVVEKYVGEIADDFKKDVLGNRIATLKSKCEGAKTLMLAAHSDEIGFIVSHIDSKGFIFFDKLGGHDDTMIAGRRVDILTKNGIVKGITGKKAIHLMTPEERKSVPKIENQWIDIGLDSFEEVSKKVRIGDSIVVDYSPVEISENRIVSKALDDKAGCYCIFDAFRKLVGKSLEANVYAVATSQEEIGTRGATTSAYALNADVSLVVDVEHATDFPTVKVGTQSFVKLGGGVVISRGPNINPVVFEMLVDLAEKHNIKYQVNAEPRPTGTDARVIQMTRGGIAIGLLGIPLRYMHTPSEVCDYADLVACSRLIEEFALALKAGDSFEY
ncbi:MAG: M42 family metallopeptidase [Opitutales bacterium]